MWLEIIIIFLGIFVVIPVTIFIIYKINKGKGLQTVIPNASLIDCTVMREATNGYCLGRVKKERPRPNGTVYFEIYPYDAEEGEDRPIPEVQRFVAHKFMVKRLPKGEDSARREKIYILSRNNTDLPEQLRDTTFGEALTTAGQLAHLMKQFGPSIPNGDQAISEILSQYSRGADKISSYSTSQIKGLLEMAKNIYEKDEPGKKG